MRTNFALFTFLLWLAPALAIAQTQPDLVVTIRDGNGRGLPGVTVTVRDQAEREVFIGTTNAQGQVGLEKVPAPELRVVVSGTVGGVNLVQLGDDAEGVQIYAATPPVSLDLRVDGGGMVIPDPAMIQPEPVEVPTALVSAASTVSAASVSIGALPTAELPAAGVTSAIAGEPAPTTAREDSGGRGVLIGVFAIAVVLAVIVLVLVHERRVA